MPFGSAAETRSRTVPQGSSERWSGRLTEYSVYVTVNVTRQHPVRLEGSWSVIAGRSPGQPSTAAPCCATPPCSAVSVPTFGALLEACADAPTGAGGGGTGTPAKLQIASPDNPVTWEIADDNPAIADGLAPEKGPLLLYNYADYIGPAVVKSFEKKYGVDVKYLDLQRHRRGDHQDPHRSGAVRHLLPELRPDQPAGHRRAGPAAQPQLPHQHRQRVAVVPEPLVRRGGALHGPLHRLHDRHRLAHRPGPRRHRGTAEPVRRPLGPGVLRQDRGHRRLAHRDGDGRAAQPA